jgi:hypothetical protein
MKKTIAILLVLTIALTGVFAALDTITVDTTTTATDAADATLRFKTLVPAINLMGLTMTDQTDSFDSTDFTTTELTSTTSITSSSETTIAYLNTESNNYTGYVIKVTSEKLNDVKAGATTPALGYTISLPAAPTAPYVAGTSTSSTFYSTTGIVGLTAVSNAISVTVASFDTAPAATYASDITFEYLAN